MLKIYAGEIQLKKTYDTNGSSEQHYYVADDMYPT